METNVTEISGMAGPVIKKIGIKEIKSKEVNIKYFFMSTIYF